MTGELAALPRSQRRRALEDLVAGELAAVLLLPESAGIPRDVAFFDLGMTSMRLTEIRQRLTRLLGVALTTEDFFEHPNLASLVEHLAAVVLGGAAPPADDPGREPPPGLGELLRELYR